MMVWPPTVTVEEPLAPLLETVPVWLAPEPPKFMLQSRFRVASPEVGGRGLRMRSGPLGGALNRAASVAKPGAAASACRSGFRFICCIM